MKLAKARGRLSEIIAVYSQEVGYLSAGEAAIEAILLDIRAARELARSCQP